VRKIRIHSNDALITLAQCVAKSRDVSRPQSELRSPLHNSYLRVLHTHVADELTSAIGRAVIDYQHVRLWHGSPDRFEELGDAVAFIVGRDDDERFDEWRLRGRGLVIQASQAIPAVFHPYQ
jgi:hypothetical protein